MTTGTCGYVDTGRLRRPVYDLGAGMIGGFSGDTPLGMTSMTIFWLLDRGCRLPLTPIATPCRGADGAASPGITPGPALADPVSARHSAGSGSGAGGRDRHAPRSRGVADSIVLPIADPASDRLRSEMDGADLGG